MPALVGERSYVLRVLNGELAGRTFDVGDEVILGRADGCGVTLPDRRLSRRHAAIRVEDGRLKLEDLSSQHGSYVNGVRTVAGPLNGGDVVGVGETRLRLETKKSAVTRPIQLVQDPGLNPQLVKEVRPEAKPNLGTRNFGILYEITQAIQSERDADAMLAQVIDQVLDAVSADRGYIATLNDDADLIPRSVRHRDEVLARFGGDQVAMSRSVADRVISDKCALISGDAAKDERFATTDTVLLNNVQALMAVPIMVGERVLGVFQVECHKPDATISESDLDLLTVVASTVGVAIDNMELARLREETIAELERAQSQLLATQEQLVLSEQMAAIGRLASGIAHEVKNHLSPFMLADMIAQRYPDDAEIQDSAQMMIEAQRHIYGLVDEIRLFARGSKADYQMAPADLGELVEGVLRFVSCDAAVKKVEISLERVDEPLVEMDSSRVPQVLINLLRNAAHATDDGEGRVRVRVLERDNEAFVDVMDNGRGIPEDVADKIFEPFFSTKGDKGLGLGLDISRKIVEAHGGTLTFNSAVGKGTTFRIALPAIPE